MDAKVLRAAVSAAIRVTVSTTLLGCGGSVRGDADGAGTASNGSGGGGYTDADQSTGGYRAAPSPVPVGTSANGGHASTVTAGAATAGAATAGAAAETGGVANAAGAGQAGEPASAGAPAEVCGGAVDACLTLLAQEPAGATLNDVGKACCETVAAGLDELRLSTAECFDDLEQRFMTMPARSICCRDQATWVHLACTPWGPPVPPELSAEGLQAWSLAA